MAANEEMPFNVIVNFADLIALRDELVRSNKISEQLGGELATLRKAHDGQLKEYAKRGNELEAARRELSAFRTEMGDAERTITTARAKIAELEHDVSILRDEVDATAGERDAAKRKLSTYKRLANDLTQIIKSALDRIAGDRWEDKLYDKAEIPNEIRFARLLKRLAIRYDAWAKRLAISATTAFQNGLAAAGIPAKLFKGKNVSGHELTLFYHDADIGLRFFFPQVSADFLRQTLPHVDDIEECEQLAIALNDFGNLIKDFHDEAFGDGRTEMAMGRENDEKARAGIGDPTAESGHVRER